MNKIIITIAVFLFSITIFARPVSTNWQQITIKDLHTIHKILVQNTQQYIDKYPPFMDWLDRGLQKSINLAKKFNSKAGYYYALGYYTRGFHNGHIAITSIDKSPYHYAGLLLKYQNDKYLVKYRDPQINKLPPINAALLSCHNRSAQNIIDHDIIPYGFVPKLEASYNQAANYLFFDANPFRHYPAQCVFKVNGHKKQYILHWKVIPYTQATKIMLHFKHQYSFRLQMFGKQGLWISIPTLFPEGNQRKFFEMIVKIAPMFRIYNPIVLDVRGNSGGNSDWAEELLAGLYGKAFISKIEWQNDHSYELYRVSRPNIELYEWISQQYPKLKLLAQQMQKAYQAGHKVFKPTADQNIIVIKAKSLFPHHIYFLTDNRCFSSCLNFADYIHWLPNTTHIGLPTSADSVYNENNLLTLSGGARFIYTMAVIRNRPRKTNQPYIPKYRYYEDISNTNALIKWVEKLFVKSKSPGGTIG